METLKNDFIRFAQLHSWYKHLPLEGVDYYVSLKKGEQVRYDFAPQVKDYEGLHWHFFIKNENENENKCEEEEEEDKENIYGPIRLGPFLQGINYNDREPYCSFQIIFSCNKNGFLDWIESNYPEYKHITFDEWSKKFNDDIILELTKKETDKYWVNLFDAIKMPTTNKRARVN